MEEVPKEITLRKNVSTAQLPLINEKNLNTLFCKTSPVQECSFTKVCKKESSGLFRTEDILPLIPHWGKKTPQIHHFMLILGIFGQLEK